MRAIRAYEKAGFRIEGRLREAILRDGRYFDEVQMGVLASEWLDGSLWAARAPRRTTSRPTKPSPADRPDAFNRATRRRGAAPSSDVTIEQTGHAVDNAREAMELLESCPWPRVRLTHTGNRPDTGRSAHRSRAGRRSEARWQERRGSALHHPAAFPADRRGLTNLQRLRGLGPTRALAGGSWRTRHRIRPDRRARS